jgi:3-hydroxymyristoyl/3-hydroxydecanoyl-(acyl carrier protein) dehydratase
VRSGDWFYRCHFLGDPVMPGSLGVEAMLQALQAYGAHTLGRRAEVSLATGQPLSWKYRGQITPATRAMSLEVQVNSVEKVNGSLDLSADASLWADGLRIYEVKGLGMNLRP